MHAVEIAIDTTNNEVVPRFTEPGKMGKHLIGSLWRHAGRTRGETDPLSPEKVD